MQRRAVLAVAIVAAALGFAAPAQAQQAGGPTSMSNTPGGGLAPNWLADRPVDPVVEEQRKQVDQDYQRSKRKIPEQTQKVDPWGTMREQPAGTSAAAKPKKAVQ